LFFVVAVLPACATRPETGAQQQARIERLSTALQTMAPDSNPAAARHFADIAVTTSAQLRQQYRVQLTPWMHNAEVNAGIKSRGLCFHYARDLGAALQPLAAPYWDLHVVQAKPKTILEHNALVVTAKGAGWQSGIVLDGWRDAGVLYIGPVMQDKYPWQPKQASAAQ
jgi:hypothetical protein